MSKGNTKEAMLRIGGISADELVREYKTPLYVLDLDAVLKNLHQYIDAMRECGARGKIFYASKALCIKEMCRIASACGAGIDVVSAGELHTAQSVGFDCENIIFHGNNKTPDELEMAIECGVGRIAIDDISEIELLEGICKQRQKRARVLLRINPQIYAHTHRYIQTGQSDSKFGIALDLATQTAKRVLHSQWLELTGLHCHIGSQILQVEPYLLSARVMIELIASIKEQTGTTLTELNLGGGFGIGYLRSQKGLDVRECISRINAEIDLLCGEKNIQKPFLMLEPGRSIVAMAGTTLYTIGAVKRANKTLYASVDGGMTDNPRYALYKARYHMQLAQAAADRQRVRVTIAGKCCESGDILGKAVLPSPKRGDILAVFGTGAYNFSMFSQYNRHLRPCLVGIGGGKHRVLVRRGTLDDLVSDEV